MKNRIMEEAPLVRLAVCLMVGIAVGEYVCWPWLLLLVGSVVAVLLAWRWPLVQSVAIAVSFVVLGALLVERQERSLRVVWPEGEVC
jgi:competence protein ComEC